MAAVDLTLVDGSTVTVVDSQVTFVGGVNNAVEVTIPTAGENPIVLEVNDTITQVKTDLNVIIEITTADGEVYINKEKVMLVTDNGSGSRIQYASDFGAYNDIILSTESRTTVKGKL
jgi:hypothetical protein